MRIESDGGGGGGSTHSSSGTQHVNTDQFSRWDVDERRAYRPAPARAPAQTSQQAVQAIHDTPLPRSDDLNGLSGAVASAVYQDRVQDFNDHRRDAAQQALDELRPDRSDYAGLNGATANAEYQDALALFNADPYVDELQRIEVEATGERDSVPAYMRTPEPTVNVTGMAVPQMRGALAALGVDLPENATPAQVAAGFELLASVPQTLMGAVINPGMQVSFTTPVAGLGTPGFIPVGASANVVVEGEVTLSDPQVGIGFAQTQRLEMAVELRGETSAGTQTTTQRRLYVWASRLERLVQGSDEIRRMVESSPLLKNAVQALPISLSASEYVGGRLTYDAVVTPEQADRIDKGDLTATPNPLNPLDMPTGTSVMITGQDLTGNTLEFGYKLMRIGSDHTELEGMGFGVRRGEGDLVEVFSGPVSSVENELFLGLGRGSFSAGVTLGTSYESQQLSVARIDLSTEEGRAAYQGFITSGQVPDWNPPGVLRAGDQDVYSSESEAYLGVNAGPLSVGVGGTNSEFNITETTWQDGSVEQTTTNTIWGATSEVSFPRDAQGAPVDAQTTWRLLVPNSHPALASYLNSAYHPDQAQREFDGEQHVQYTFSTEQLMSLRSMARDYVLKRDGDGGAEQMALIESGEVFAWWSDRAMGLATAKTPEEIFEVIESRPEEAAGDLMIMAYDMGAPVPGTIEFRDAGD
jgi:hypothetical protein